MYILRYKILDGIFELRGEHDLLMLQWNIIKSDRSQHDAKFVSLEFVG
jgi:hypothetical protein